MRSAFSLVLLAIAVVNAAVIPNLTGGTGGLVPPVAVPSPVHSGHHARQASFTMTTAVTTITSFRQQVTTSWNQLQTFTDQYQAISLLQSLYAQLSSMVAIYQGSCNCGGLATHGVFLDSFQDIFFQYQQIMQFCQTRWAGVSTFTTIFAQYDNIFGTLISFAQTNSITFQSSRFQFLQPNLWQGFGINSIQHVINSGLSGHGHNIVGNVGSVPGPRVVIPGGSGSGVHHSGSNTIQTSNSGSTALNQANVNIDSDVENQSNGNHIVDGKHGGNNLIQTENRGTQIGNNANINIGSNVRNQSNGNSIHN